MGRNRTGKTYLRANAQARATGYDWDEIGWQIEVACQRAMRG
jgi:hypothetical protein